MNLRKAKIISFVIAGGIGAVFLLAAVQETFNRTEKNEAAPAKVQPVQAAAGELSEFRKYSEFGGSGNVKVFVDPETGVEYLVYAEKVGYAGCGGITPRLNPDGTVRVRSDDE